MLFDAFCILTKMHLRCSRWWFTRLKINLQKKENVRTHMHACSECTRTHAHTHIHARMHVSMFVHSYARTHINVLLRPSYSLKKDKRFHLNTKSVYVSRLTGLYSCLVPNKSVCLSSCILFFFFFKSLTVEEWIPILTVSLYVHSNARTHAYKRMPLRTLSRTYTPACTYTRSHIWMQALLQPKLVLYIRLSSITLFAHSFITMALHLLLLSLLFHF